MFSEDLFILALSWKQPADVLMGNKNVEYSYKGMLFSHKKEWFTETRWKMDGSKIYYDE